MVDALIATRASHMILLTKVRDSAKVPLYDTSNRGGHGARHRLLRRQRHPPEDLSAEEKIAALHKPIDRSVGEATDRLLRDL